VSNLKPIFSPPRTSFPLIHSETDHPVVGWLVRRGVNLNRARLIASLAFGRALANASPRCGARRRDGETCRGAAMANGRCRMHGGPSTGPRTPEGLARSRRSNWKHGYYSAKAKRVRRDARQQYRLLRQLIAAGTRTTFST
jgi:hypothetical protein